MPLVAVEVADSGEDLAHDQRRKAKGGLVEEQEARPRHEGPCDGQHLLLAARKRAAALALALLENGKEGKGALRDPP